MHQMSPRISNFENWRLWYTNEAVIAGLGAVICLPGQHFSLVSCSAGGQLQLLLVMSRSLMGSRRGSYRCGDITTPRWHNVTPPYTAQWASTGGHLVILVIWEEWRLSWESLKKNICFSNVYLKMFWLIWLDLNWYLILNSHPLKPHCAPVHHWAVVTSLQQGGQPQPGGGGEEDLRPCWLQQLQLRHA